MRNLISLRAKANAKYTCQECGSTELIQAHHQIPGDDDSLVVLCAECHSKRHPNLSKALFFNKNNQPYWYNKSASSLARELGVHPRTIIRAAKRAGIKPGKLNQCLERLLRHSIPKLVQPKKKIPVCPTRICPRCRYTWKAKKISAMETTCPRCGNWIALKNPTASYVRKERKIFLFPEFILKNLERQKEMS